MIAEGVENGDQLALLRDCGCDFIQGFLFSRPMLHAGLWTHLTLFAAGCVLSWAGGLLRLWSIVYIAKSQYIDLDPLNVYFWLFVGLLFRVPTLAACEPVGEADEAPRARPLEAVASE